jgi:hypothetical protein
MKKLLPAAFAASPLAVQSSGATAAQAPGLNFASPTPPFGALYQNGFAKWVEEMSASAGDAGQIKVFPGGIIGNFGIPAAYREEIKKIRGARM